MSGTGYPLVDASDELAALVIEITTDSSHPSLNDLQEAVAHYWKTRGNTPERYLDAGVPFNSIEEKIDRCAWVLRRLVATLGFQAELRVFGGDFGEHGPQAAERGARISLTRKSFETEHIVALTQFAEEHECDLEFSQDHGATLRLKGKNHKISAEDTVELSALTTGAAAGAGSTAMTVKGVSSSRGDGSA